MAKNEPNGPVMNRTYGHCPDCGRDAPMTVHADCRVYQPCGHRYPLPPLPGQRFVKKTHAGSNTR